METNSGNVHRSVYCIASHAEAGIETYCRFYRVSPAVIASHAEAGMETYTQERTDPEILIASHVEAGMETSILNSASVSGESPLTQRREWKLLYFLF